MFFSKNKLSLIILVFLSLSLLSISAKTVTIRANSINYVLSQDIFNICANKYVLKGEFDLHNQSLYIPDNVTVLLRGAALSNGEIHLGNKTVLKGENGICNKIRIIGENVDGIQISNLIMNGEGTKDLNNLFRFMRCTSIKISKVKTTDYYRTYHSGKELKNDDGFLWYPFLCKDCAHITIDNYTCERTYPEGPFFIGCKDIRIDKMSVSDSNNLKGYDIWTTLNLFYCTGVEVKNSSFHKRTTGFNAGSLVNATCRDLVFRKCDMYGGNGIDLSNEWYDKDFISKNILIDNCIVLNSSYGIGTEPTPNIIEDVIVKNSTIKIAINDKEYGFPIVAGSVRNFKVQNTHISGLIYLQLSGDQAFSGEVGNVSFVGCHFDDDYYGVYTGQQGPILVRNSTRNMCAGAITFNGCSFDAHKLGCQLAANNGSQLDLTITNTHFTVKSLDFSGDYNKYNLLFENNTVRLDSFFRNRIHDYLGNAEIKGNTFINETFHFYYSNSNSTILSNYFISDAEEQAIVVENSKSVRMDNNTCRTK